ncbi:MAG TPA: beta-hydroxyacyl-ACP dehydratase [Syntrophobacteraceae bacterium]|nr:beta-hydroxyacyl-ACP dehydratase [Syntrophobacteraceae bacterium]
MRYLLVDRITDWKAGESITGIKNVAMSEDFLEFHFPGNPVMPGALLLEALVQLTGWLRAASSDFAEWFLLGTVRKCNFYGFILPGDQVQLEVHRLRDSSSGQPEYQGIAAVEGKKKIKVSFSGEQISLDSIEDVAEQRKFFQVLTRNLAV